MKKIFILLLFIGLTFFAFGNEWDIKEVSDGLFEGRRSDGKNVVVLIENGVSEAVVEKITNSLDVVWSIPGIQGTKASVNVESDTKFRFIIYPTELIYEDINLAENLPSGMAFYYDSALFYDVNLKVDNLVPRVTGAYISPDDLLIQLKTATSAPDLYMYDEYVLERLDRLENAVMALSKKGLFAKPSEVPVETVLAIRSIYNDNPDLTPKQILNILKEQGIKASASDVAAVRLVYLGIID